MTAVFQLRNITKEYEGTKVLSIPALDLDAGYIYGVMGPSGAGKSTLLRILNLLEQPSAGQLFFNGTEVKGKAPLEMRRKMTMVFQRPVLFNSTVLDNIIFGLSARGVPKKEAREEGRQALVQVGLEGFAHRHACELSGGEGQRIALARALVIRPRVLLLDEPTANLDPANVAAVEEITRRLNRDYDTTVIMVTHNIFQAQRMADQVLFLYKGELVEQGTVREVFKSARDPRTRSFIEGEMIY